MKATRYQQPDRHLQPDMEDSDMSTDQPTEANDNQGTGNPGNTLEVDVGNAMPPVQPAHLPLLQTMTASTSSAQDVTEAAHARSLLAEGMHFVGNAILRGPFSVAGQVDGNLEQAHGTLASVVVTETGRVKGDITAHKISVMGHTDGILDSGQGEVSLHDTADVHGLVRYGRIQVNGASLNATLERVPTSGKNH
jgi:cytoskeletal protein CcmA (bactofilin family)